MSKNTWVLAILLLTLGATAAAQNEDSTNTEQKSSAESRGIKSLFNYLNMAGTTKAADFRPLTQKERTQIYLKTTVNPLGYLKSGFSAGIDQWKDKPLE